MSNFIKNKNEIETLFESGQLAVECMKYISTKLVYGVSEFNLARKIREWFKKHGATKLAFPSIVCFSESGVDPHHHPSKTRTLNQNDLVLIDIGCVYKGQCSDITRTFLPLKPSKKQLKIYNIVLEANKLGIAKAKVGMKACELDKICRDYITKKGYGKYFIHTTGHSIGKVVHDGMRIGKNDQTILKNKMFFTIEPGIYLPNEFGIRIEDTVCLLNNKIHVLTGKMPK